jgi:hypothetical protein
MARDRFVNSALSELQEANRSPIYGYQHLRLMPLEEATETLIPLVPGVIDYVSTAKNECNRNTTLLTWDESAAIYLYTMPIPFFSLLNETLRAEDRHALQPWFAFLKLFITALQRLPSIEKTVWRGVSGDFGTEFDDGYVHTWWSVNSCSPDISVVEHFLPTLDNLDNSSTLFAIDAIHAIDISAFSKLSEQEIVLIPGTRLRAKAHSLSFEDRFFLVHLEEETSQRLVCLNIA